MSSKNPYAGKIGNTGSQVVKAPYSGNVSKGKSVVKSGSDLRAGSGASKK